MNIFQEKINITIVFCSLFILGIVSFFAQIQYCSIFFVAFLAIFLIYKQKLKFIVALAMIFSFLSGFYIADIRVKESDALFYFAPKNNVTIEGQVVSILETNKPDKTRFYFRADKIKSGNIEQDKLNSKVLVTLLEPKEIYSSINIGDKLELKGKLRLPAKAANPAEFSYANYLRTQNTFTTFFVEKNNFKLRGKPNEPGWKCLQVINKQRDFIIKKHSAIISSPYLELLGGVVFGDDAITPTDDLKESFKISGLLHLLAASGLNVGIIFSIWFFIGKTVKIGYKPNIIIGGLLIILYTCMTGFSPSILRATLMIEFVLLGKLIDRQADNFALISFVCFLMLLYNPSWVCSIGFQLSFIVTAALLIGMPILSKWSEEKFSKFMQYGINAVGVPLIAQICVLPLQMYYFNTVALYSVVANILVLPFITVVSFLGFFTSILSAFHFMPYMIIKILDMILFPFLWVTVFISDTISKLPYSNMITIQPSIVQVCMYYFLLLLLVLYIKSKDKKILISGMAIFLIFAFTFINIQDDKLHLTFFAVKNADSCLIKTPKNHYFVIDTGKKSFNNTYSQGDSIIAKYLLSKKITKIDFVVLSHLDNDHIGGTVGLLQKIKVNKVFVNVDTPTTATSKELFEYLKNNNIQYEIVKNNTTIYKEDNLQLKAYLQKSLDENENSIINTLQYKSFNAVFMGDAGENSYKILPVKTKIDVLKLGHHGAQGTINQSVLSTYEPKNVIISTGQNQYGHPHFSTIDLLLNSNINYYRTDEKNTIEFISDGNVLSDRCFSTQKNKFSACKK